MGAWVFREHALSGPVLRDTARLSQRYPLLRAMGFLVSQHGQLGAIPPPPFLSVSPLEYMRSRGAIPPPPQRYLSDTSAIPYENKADRCDTPLCDTSSKGYCAIWWVSRTGPLRACCPPLRHASMLRATIASKKGMLCYKVLSDPSEAGQVSATTPCLRYPSPHITISASGGQLKLRYLRDTKPLMAPPHPQH